MQFESFQSSLSVAHEFARLGKNDEFLQSCQSIANTYIQDDHVLTQIASLLLGFGFSSQAKRCLDQALLLSPDNKNALLSLGLCELQLGSIDRFQAIAQELIQRYPNDLKVMSHVLYLSEYVDQEGNEFVLALAKRWGECAIQWAGGEKPRPPFHRLTTEPLRIGYVSSDFCQHTVGILIKEVLRQHNPKCVKVFCYSSGSNKDWVTQEIATHSTFIEVSSLTNSELAAQISKDHIDVLIDLSGHTGGSRLSAFAYRPAAVMISMLGYYATTGLTYIDACLLDEWHLHQHAKQDTQQDFIEPVLSLGKTRWCYYPAFPAPAPAVPPCIHNGYVTFASFNNTLKYNPQVYALWAQILKEAPNSKLILKWRTFNDEAFRQSVLSQFQILGVDSSRIELRGPSFHMQMLQEYQDVDIALDPFPFSGGATSCEALYMGVPVITWPQTRVVSRQTFAYLSLIGHPELIANSPEEYLAIAKQLAQSPERLTLYREQLRMEMIQSPLMDIKTYTSNLEDGLLNLHQKLASSQQT